MFNNVTLIGCLGSNAESRNNRNNNAITVVSLATRRTWKSHETGERESQTTWHRFVVFRRTAEYAATLTKGAHLQILDEIQTRDYTGKDGVKKSVTEIRVQRIARLDHAEDRVHRGGRQASGSRGTESRPVMTIKASRRESLILDHLPQDELLARRLHRRCPQVELDDLIQAGTIGLIQAVDRYDESRGYLLKTIAEHRIRGAGLDYLRQIYPLPRNFRRFQK